MSWFNWNETSSTNPKQSILQVHRQNIEHRSARQIQFLATLSAGGVRVVFNALSHRLEYFPTIGSQFFSISAIFLKILYQPQNGRGWSNMIAPEKTAQLFFVFPLTMTDFDSMFWRWWRSPELWNDPCLTFATSFRFKCQIGTVKNALNRKRRS